MMISAYDCGSRGKKRGNCVFNNHVERLDMLVEVIQCGSHTSARHQAKKRLLRRFFVLPLI